MAKVTEGDPYYFIPRNHSSENYRILKRGEHPHKEIIVEQADLDNASLIVDALNNFHQCFVQGRWPREDAKT